MLRSLSDRPGRSRVVAVDFSGARPEAGFRDLFPVENGLVEAWETIPPGLDGEELIVGDARRYLTAIAGEVCRMGDGPLCLAGYCSSASLVAALADLVRERVSISLIALFNPYLVTPATVAEAFTEIAKVMDISAPERLTRTEEMIAAIRGTDFGEGLPQDLVEGMRARYLAWLGFLHAAVSVPLEFGGERLSVYNSSITLDAVPVESAGPQCVRDFAETAGDLLASADVRTAFLEDLTASATQ